MSVAEVWVPTATQNDTVTHDTADRVATPAGAGLGVSFHCVPSHDSTNGTDDDPELAVPTAMQNDALTHETELSRLPAAGAGTGVLDHVIAVAAPTGATANASIDAQTRTTVIGRRVLMGCAP
jgi:hypothetical protein